MGDGEKRKPAEHLDLPFRTWVGYYQDAMNLVHLTYDGLGSTDFRIELGNILQGNVPETDEQREKRQILEAKSKDAHREIDADYPTLHAHSLLGLWGSLERLIEDIFLASILNDPTLMAHEKLSKVKLPVEVVLGNDEERANAVLTEFVRSVGSGQKKGTGQFEVMLKPVKLDGHVPRSVQDAVLLAQQIRHVWAHRGGVADARFVENCESRASVGEKLSIGQREFHHLSNGIQMYGLIVLNRHFANLGREVATVEISGYEGAWDEIGMGGGNNQTDTDSVGT